MDKIQWLRNSIDQLVNWLKRYARPWFYFMTCMACMLIQTITIWMWRSQYSALTCYTCLRRKLLRLFTSGRQASIPNHPENVSGLGGTAGQERQPGSVVAAVHLHKNKKLSLKQVLVFCTYAHMWIKWKLSAIEHPFLGGEWRMVSGANNFLQSDSCCPRVESKLRWWYLIWGLFTFVGFWGGAEGANPGGRRT